LHTKHNHKYRYVLISFHLKYHFVTIYDKCNFFKNGCLETASILSNNYNFTFKFNTACNLRVFNSQYHFLTTQFQETQSQANQPTLPAMNVSLLPTLTQMKTSFSPPLQTCTGRTAFPPNCCLQKHQFVDTDYSLICQNNTLCCLYLHRVKDVFYFM